MLTFFTGLVIVGISLILISIVMVLFDRKRDMDEKEEYLSIKNELRELLEDSNDMVDELNRFSDYVVTKVDEKCAEYMSLIKEAPEVNSTPISIETKQDLIKETGPITEPVIEATKPADPVFVNSSNESAPDEKNLEGNILYSEDIEPIASLKDNSSSINSSINPKHSEVIRLFEAGMSDIEIAKALNMGKGEVQLIVGLNIHKIKV